MALFKLKTVSTILIEDDYNKNILPIISELVENTEGVLSILSYELPLKVWKKIFRDKSIQCFKDFQPEKYVKANGDKIIFVIDSVNQMALELGWDKCLKYLRNIQSNRNVIKLIIILHKDCLLNESKIQLHLHHIANAIITYDDLTAQKIWIQVKKNGKIFKSEEMISYDSKTNVLKLSPVIKFDKKEDEPEKNLSPGSLTTFKIETDQIQQLERHKLKLPYMSKINEGQGKVYYEPDAVDDWDDEDPDDDLDI